MHIPVVPNWLTISYAAVAVTAAIWRGGVAERLVAAIAAVQLANAFVLRWTWLSGTPTDLIALSIVLPLVLSGRRYWIVWSAASITLSLATDLVAAGLEVSNWARLSAQRAWFYVLVTSVLVGALTRRPLKPPHVAPG